ncbi:hypothetical protein [Thauera linaloolentis]|uniref:Uncharacterized protein n=1 Tax=Thauera linaloolentis (strain DSM 12138 / JCM 21573 / CCUG 41526 / CIP 105981 / IAM 15112 / NBRC 102519 / 47Lol) TaxID=1123367 RepID=N6XQR6_THAL4|nr:hypothetical protein [Thauera linaloolentis]ENO84031.1 hypothetical protein C666_18025 [Thauera linaloolentis 47Lol = DSM 12138]MCM8565124.1 hypothetical protein [Thauera linaloolentis]
MSRPSFIPALPRTLLSLSAAALLSLPPAVSAQAPIPPDTPPRAAAERAAEDARRTELEARAKVLRNEAETTFAATEAGCYRKFLVNRCIDQARQQRLETIQRARALEAEARQIDLAQRQRAAAEVQAAQRTAPPAEAAKPSTDVPTPAATATPVPAPDARIAPAPEAERIRAERARAASEAAAGEQAARAARDAERATKRAETEAEAGARAEAAARDRARYEERIRKYEEEQAAQKK